MDVRDVLSATVGFEPHDADLAGVREQLARIAQLRAFADAAELAAKRRLDELDQQGVTVWPERDLEVYGRTSRRDAQRVARRQQAAAVLPQLGESLAAGELSGAHLDALHQGLAPLSVEERDRLVEHDGCRLARLATSTTPDEFARTVKTAAALVQTDGGLATFERQRRANRLRTWTDRLTGMTQLAAALDPESGAKLIGRLRTLAEELFHDRLPDTCPVDPIAKQDHLRALALVSLVDGNVSGAGRPDLIVVVDEHTLRAGLHDQTVIDVDGEIVLPVETLRRLSCDANIIPVVLNGHGVSVDVGHGSRLATQPQRRALRAMYPTCAVHGCRVPFQQCTVHHVLPWEHGGATDLGNLLPLCTRHHHAAHEGRWDLDLHPTTRVLTITYPDGNTDTHPPPRARAA